MRKFFIIIALFAIFQGIGIPYCSSSEDDDNKVAFTDLIATTSETHVILFGVINNAFSEEMLSGVKSGVPVDFSFFIELFKRDSEGVDDVLAEMHFRHTLTYDTLKDNYKVELEEFNNKIVLFQDIADAQKTMSEINGLEIVELSRLLHDSTYLLRIRADLFKKTLPLSLHRILPFFSWWDRETDWHTLQFNF